MSDLRARGRPANADAGLSLVEVLVALAVSALVVASLTGVVARALDVQEQVLRRNDLNQQARFALERMLRSAERSRRLLVPLVENPSTAWSESVRDVLAVTLDPDLDRDGDGVADADNDGDGLVDEDWGDDGTADGASGIVGIDDDGDGSTDEGAVGDDDEDGAPGEDALDGADDDGDGSSDEDSPGDLNGDGQPGMAGVDDDGDGSTDEGAVEDDDEDGVTDEDWVDGVVYRVQGGSLLERLPTPGASDGAQFVEREIASGVTNLRVERLPLAGGRAQLVDVTLELTGADGESVSLRAAVRLGAALGEGQ